MSPLPTGRRRGVGGCELHRPPGGGHSLIGPSGGGKSTACKLAARFWGVTGGKVSLGGTDVSTVDPETLLRSYSMVFQDVVLFRDR